MLYNNKIRSHSDQLLTHKNYALSFFYIVQLVQGRDDIGLTYKLINVKTAKSFRRLLPADRLKPYSADRTDILARLPSNLHKKKQNPARTTGTGQNKTKINEKPKESELSWCESARRILTRTE